MDGSRLSGAIAYVDRGRPAFGARLELDRLNIDAYLPPNPPPGVPTVGPARALPPLAAAAPATTTTTAGRVALSPLSWLMLADANLDLSIGQVTLRGLPAQGIHLDATVAGGAVTIREAKVDDLVGLKGRVDGQIAGLSPLRGVNLAVSAEAANLGGLPRAVAWPAGVPTPERLGAVSAKARLAGDASRLALELTAGVAGGALEAGGSLLTLDTRPAADVKLRVTHPELGRLTALFTDRGQARAYGPLDLYTEFSGSLAAPTWRIFRGSSPGCRCAGGSAVISPARAPRSTPTCKPAIWTLTG